MMPGKKGQVSVEFLIAIVFLLILFSMVLFITGERNSFLTIDKTRLEAKLAAKTLSDAVSTVYLAGNGASMQVTLRHKDLNFTTEPGKVNMFHQFGFEQFSFPTKSIQSSEINLPAKVKVSNNNGVIEFVTE